MQDFYRQIQCHNHTLIHQAVGGAVSAGCACCGGKIIGCGGACGLFALLACLRNVAMCAALVALSCFKDRRKIKKIATPKT